MFFLSHTSELIIGQNISIGSSGQMTEKLEIAAESNLQDCDLTNQNRKCGGCRRLAAHISEHRQNEVKVDSLIHILFKMLNNGIQSREIIRAQCLNNGCFNVTGNSEGRTLESTLHETVVHINFFSSQCKTQI